MRGGGRQWYVRYEDLQAFVEDQATRQWMAALYENRLVKKLATVDAVREASVTMLRQRRAKGISTHPLYWAAFVATGDWR